MYRVDIVLNGENYDVFTFETRECAEWFSETCIAEAEAVECTIRLIRSHNPKLAFELIRNDLVELGS